MTKKERNIKVYCTSGYQYRDTPTIMLKGQWLKEAGFEIGDYITVKCEDGRLVIAQDAERAKAEAETKEKLEKERKALKKRQLVERCRLREQMVAEQMPGYQVEG